LSTVRIVNDPVALGMQIEDAGPNPEVVLEATYGWYWAVDALQAAGADVHLAHPLGVKGFRYRRVKNDVRDAGDLADLLRMGRLPEAWIAPPAIRELRELVRYRAKLVAIRSGLVSTAPRLRHDASAPPEQAAGPPDRMAPRADIRNCEIRCSTTEYAH
jgi:transposase